VKYIELFGGIGGFRKGIEQAGADWECVWYNDIDKYATQIYNKNFSENWEPRDIRDVAAEEISGFNLLCAGFPCQSFSVAGKRRGMEDTRGTLFFEICRLLKHHRPKILFLENVRGLLSHDKGHTFGIILESLGDLGYDVEWQVLNSKNFGVPQNRERVFIIGHLGGSSGRQVFPLGESDRWINERAGETPVIRTLQGGGHSGGHHSGEHRKKQIRRDTIPPLRANTGAGHNNIIVESGLCNSRGFETRKDGLSHCLKGGGGGTSKVHIMFEDHNIRRLTPVECERLQGFPDGWTEGVSDTQRYKCLGNAVTVNVIQAIAEQIRRSSER